MNNSEEKTEYIKTRSMKDSERIIELKSKREYCHISREKKQQLIQTVLKQGCRIKKIAKDLKINYATAKTILHAFKKKRFSIELENDKQMAQVSEYRQGPKLKVEVKINNVLSHSYEFYGSLNNK